MSIELKIVSALFEKKIRWRSSKILCTIGQCYYREVLTILYEYVIYILARLWLFVMNESYVLVVYEAEEKERETG